MIKDWEKLFNSLKNKAYINDLKIFLDREYKSNTIFPKRELIFNAFKLTNPSTLKIVIIGQDPYHEINQAMGLAFSVPKGVILPPSLKNIYKEIENEYQEKMDYGNGDLTYLASQGVLLLNTILTVREHIALSHNIKEYEFFIEDILNYIDELPQNIVFMLWGNNAKHYKKYIKNNKRLILVSSHPSPLSANKGGWFNNNHFKLANIYLNKNNINEINWINK